MAYDNATNGQESQEDRKLFVGGLSWETTEKELREYFCNYGEIQNVNLKIDPNTGQSRGFGFIVFTKAESLDKILSAGEHTIQGKKVDAKKAKARQGKIFVGGLPIELTDDEIKNYFSQYGTIAEVQMPFDKTKNQRKGFCFITFESESTVNKLLKTPKQSINGKMVDVKKATPRPEMMGGGPMGFGMGMPRGGMRGGPRGARGAARGRGGFGPQAGGWGQGFGGGYEGYGQGGYGAGYEGYGSGYDYPYGGGYEGGYGNYDYSGGPGFAGKQRGAGRGANQRHTPY